MTMEDDFWIPCPLRDGVQRQGFVSSLWLDLGSKSPKVKVEVCSVIKSCPNLCDPMGCSLPDSSVHEFPRQEYWSSLPFPSSGNLPDSGIEPTSPGLAGKPPG